MGRSPRGRSQSDTTERLPLRVSLSRLGGGHGNPLQCSCLENPRDGGARWATVCGVDLAVAAVLAVLARAIRQEREIKGIKLER